MIAFILADLRRFWSGAIAVIILLALSVALSTVVTLQERAVRLGTARVGEIRSGRGGGWKRHPADLVIGVPATIALAADVGRDAWQAYC